MCVESVRARVVRAALGWDADSESTVEYIVTVLCHANTVTPEQDETR